MNSNALSRTQVQSLTLGSRQSDRLSDALLAGHFDVDEMSFETLLVLAKQIAAKLHFYNLDNHRDGSWEPMFLGNELVIIAMLQTINTRRITMEFEEQLKGNIDQSIGIIIEIFSQIDVSYRALKTSDSKAAHELCLKISSVIDKKLLEQLQAFKSIAAGANSASKPQMDQFIASLDPLWGMEAQQEEGGKELSPQLQVSTLRQCFTTLLNVVRFLQTDIHIYIQDLKKQSDHAPALGLLMAFLKLYRLSQQELNRFTMKHLDFYYQKLLKFTPEQPKPESCYLVFNPSKGLTQPSVLPKGTELTCGKNAQLEDIIFALDEDLLLSNIKVSSVLSLFLHRDPLISPESELHYVTQVVKNRLDLDAKSVTEDHFPTFGANSLLGSKNRHSAELGFGISAPILNLKEGHRDISLVIALTEYQQINAHSLYQLVMTNNPTQKLQLLAGIFSELLSSEASNELASLQGSVQPKGDGLNAYTQLFIDTLKPWQRNAIFGASAAGARQVIYKHYLLTLLELATSEAHFYRTLGRIFSRHTLACLECCGQKDSAPDADGSQQLKQSQQLKKPAWLTQLDIHVIEEKAKQYNESSGLSRLLRLLKQDQLRTFYELYETMFEIKISTQDGWLEIGSYRVKPLNNKIKGDDLGLYGFQFDIPLSADIAAIVPCEPAVHGDKWPSGEPCIQFSIKPLSTFFPYSIFRNLILSAVNIDVTVKGVTELVAYNNHGRLDPSKTFVPFGALPTLHSYLILGSEEMAIKHIKDIEINIDWAQLPMGFGGFREHYLGYSHGYTNQSFKANIQVLRDGNWVSGSQNKRFNLFDTQASSEKPLAHKCLSTSVVNEFKPVTRGRAELEFDYNLKSRNGFIKLALTAPQPAFGHQEYPSLLTQTLLTNAKSKRPVALPNAPYTPTIDKLSLNYHGETVIFLHPLNQTKNLAHHSVTHIHPFGFQQIYPLNESRRQGEQQTLFPRYGYDGNLFIGLVASALADEISLFFQFDEKANLNRSEGGSDIRWSYLVDNHWHAFSERQIISDSTSGFITSGIVTLKLPNTMTANNSVMPSGQYWIRASANRDLSCYGRCLSVSAHGAKVTRQLRSDESGESLKGLQSWKPMQAIVGLGQISQLTPSFAGRTFEGERKFKQRVNERLRHKGRAVSPWDYERLILQEFPDVDRVKCFANLKYCTEGTFPGHILILVRLNVPHCGHTPCDNFHASSEMLNRIQKYISGLCSAFVKLDVRNPIYESLQVRCAVKFTQGEHPGSAISKLNQELCDFLCPWSERGNGGFGWALKIQDITAFIRHRPYIKFVTQVSALQIVAGEQGELVNYRLIDSVNAKGMTPEASPTEPLIQGSAPWCLLMPFSHHVIDLVDDEYERVARVTGVDELEVGGNFIVSDGPSIDEERDEARDDARLNQKGSQHNG